MSTYAPDLGSSSNPPSSQRTDIHTLPIRHRPFTAIRQVMHTLRIKASRIHRQRLSRQTDRDKDAYSAEDTEQPCSSDSESPISPPLSPFDEDACIESRLTTPGSIPSKRGKERERYATFDPFPRLPTELRLRIWEVSLSPQLLPFVLSGPTQQSPLDARSCRRYPWRHISSPLRKVPGILHVNQEARGVALKWFTETRMRARVEWFELGDADDTGLVGSIVTTPTVDTSISTAATQTVTNEDEVPDTPVMAQAVSTASAASTPEQTDAASPATSTNTSPEFTDADDGTERQPDESDVEPSNTGITAALAAAPRESAKHPQCLMEAVVARRNKYCYWRSSTDIIWLSSSSIPVTYTPTLPPPYKLCSTDLCAHADKHISPATALASGDPARTCNTESAHCEFLFDRRVKYLAMDKGMWSVWIRSAMTVCSGLEIVWVVVDRETKVRNSRAETANAERESGMGGPSASGNAGEGSTNGGEGSASASAGRVVKKGKKKGFDDTHISSKSSTWERVEVRLVESVEEIFAEVEGWS